MMKLAVLFLVFGTQTALAGKEAIVQELVEHYQEAAKARFGITINLEFRPGNILQMTGGHSGEQLVITVYAGALEQFDELAIVHATCHEVGHILGEVPMGIVDPNSTYHHEDSVEGEADYFAGKCARDYLGSEALAIEAVRSANELIYNRTINEELAREQVYAGINSRYPSAECRMLSSMAGALGKERPRCWYNP